MELTLHAQQLALAGRRYEERPYIGVSGNWTTAYDGKTPAFEQTGAREWACPLGRIVWSVAPADATERPRLTLLQHVHTRFSDIPDIDAKESERVWRCKRAGDASIDLGAIAAAARASADGVAVVPVVMVDDALVQRAMARSIEAAAGGDKSVFQNPVQVLGEAKVKELEGKALLYAFKGLYMLEARLVDPLKAPASVASPESLAAASFAPIMGTLETDYIQVATDIAAPRPPTIKNFPADANSKLGPDLHMQSVAASTGPYLPVGYLMSTPLQRKLDVGAGASVRHLDASLCGAILARGMTPDQCIRAIDAQFKETGTAISDDYLAVLEVATRLGTNVANAVDYTSDSRYPNMSWLSQQSEAEQRIYAPELFEADGPGALPRAGNKWAPLEFALPARLAKVHTHAPAVRLAVKARLDRVRPVWARALTAALASKARYLGPAYLFADGATVDATTTTKAAVKVKTFEEAVRVGIEDWATTVPAGQSWCDDCEGVTQLFATVIITATQRLAPGQTAASHPSYRPLCAAFGRVLASMAPMLIGASVSEPYVDTSAPAAAKGKVVPPPHPSLPLIGSAEDVKTKEGGHALGHLETKASIAAKALKGLELYAFADAQDQARVAAKLRAVVAAAPPWQLRQPILLAEGTGAVHPFILPPQETYRGMPREKVLVAKSRARIHMARRLRNPTTPVGASALARMTRVETQPYEDEARADPQQRISPFYREPFHAIIPWLAEEVSPLLGQMLIVDASTQTRGVDQGLYLRDAVGARDRVVLVSPTAQGKTEAWWRAEVEPRQLAAIRQQPCSSWAWSERATPRHEQVAQRLTTQNVAALASVGGAATTTATAGAAAPLLQSVSARLDALPLVPHDLPAPDAAAMRLLETAHASNDRTVLLCSIPHWKFEGPTAAADTREMLATLEGMQARREILAHVFVRDRALPLASDQVQLLLVLPVTV